MTQQDIIRKLKIIKITCDIDNQYIADYLGMKNARSVANFLHNDYNLSDEKRRCKCQYKNVGFIQNNYVGKPTFLFCIFSLRSSVRCCI